MVKAAPDMSSRYIQAGSGLIIMCSNSPTNNDEPRRGESLLRVELRTNSMPTDSDWLSTRYLEHADISISAELVIRRRDIKASNDSPRHGSRVVAAGRVSRITRLSIKRVSVFVSHSFSKNNLRTCST